MKRFRISIVVLLTVMLPAAGALGAEHSRSGSPPDDWKAWSARPELAPETAFVKNAWRVASDGSPSCHGGWDLNWKSPAPGNWHRVEAMCRVSDIGSVHDGVHAELIFWRKDGKRAGWRHVGFEKWRQIMSGRAMDNHVWLVVCQNKGEWGCVVRPDGEIVAEMSLGSAFALAEIDLDFRHDSWIGSDFENRNWGERRPDLYRDLVKDRGAIPRGR